MGVGQEFQSTFGDNNAVEIINAEHICGLGTGETTDLIKKERRDDNAQVICIGPAGENLVRYACIVSGTNVAGRSGLGAVMGSKNLKAVAVKGTSQVKVAKEQEFLNIVNKVQQKIYASGNTKLLRTYGTMGYVPFMVESGRLNIKNFSGDRLSPDDFEKISPENFKSYEIKTATCLDCPIYCIHFYKMDNIEHSSTCGGIQANDLANFGSRLCIYDVPDIIRMHYLCNEYGLDQDSSAGSIGWAIECYENGILTENETDGLKLSWGDSEIVLRLLRKIAFRDGFGNLLAEGSKKASDIIGKGSDKFAIHIKGQDSMEALRGAVGWALGCVVSTRGGTHLRGANMIGDFFRGLSAEYCIKTWGVGEVGNPLSYENKAKLVVYYESLKAVVDSLGICVFATNWASPDLLNPEDLSELYSAAIGIQVKADELMFIGTRINNIEKAFNTLHAGFARTDDYPPNRFMEESIKSGPLRGEKLEKDKWDKMLDEYYELQGWNKATGWQTRKCLENLELKEIAVELENAGKLPK